MCIMRVDPDDHPLLLYIIDNPHSAHDQKHKHLQKLVLDDCVKKQQQQQQES